VELSQQQLKSKVLLMEHLKRGGLCTPSAKQISALHYVFNASGFNYKEHVRPGTTHQHEGQAYTRFPLVGMGDKLPQPEGDQYKIVLFHASTMAGITGILHDKAIKTRGFDQGGAGHQGAYGRGHIEEEGDPAKNKQKSLHKLHQVGTMNKNRCGIVIEARIVALWKRLPSGGWEAEEQWVTKERVCCTGADKRICFKPEIARLTGLWLAGEIADIDDDSFTGL